MCEATAHPLFRELLVSVCPKGVCQREDHSVTPELLESRLRLRARPQSLCTVTGGPVCSVTVVVSTFVTPWT